MTCVIDDDNHHYTECRKCDGSWFGTEKCRPEKCTQCPAGYESSYLRVMKNWTVSEDGKLQKVKVNGE